MKNNIDFEKVKEEVRKLVSEIIEVTEEKLLEDARFAEDLGADSMKALEIVACIEKKFKVAIPEEKILKISSLQDVYELLAKQMK